MRKKAFSLFRYRGRGLYYYAFYDADGVRRVRSTGSKSPADAERIARKALGRGSLSDFASGMFEEGSLWVSAKREAGRSLSARYLKEKMYHLESYILPEFGA